MLAVSITVIAICVVLLCLLIYYLYYEYNQSTPLTPALPPVTVGSVDLTNYPSLLSTATSASGIYQNAGGFGYTETVSGVVYCDGDHNDPYYMSGISAQYWVGDGVICFNSPNLTAEQLSAIGSDPKLTPGATVCSMANLPSQSPAALLATSGPSKVNVNSTTNVVDIIW